MKGLLLVVAIGALESSLQGTGAQTISETSCADFDLGNGNTADIDHLAACNTACTQQGMMPKTDMVEPVPVILDEGSVMGKTFECICKQADDAETTICGPTAFIYEFPEQTCVNAGVGANEDCEAACRDIAPWLNVTYSSNGGSILCRCVAHPDGSPQPEFCNDANQTSGEASIMATLWPFALMVGFVVMF